MSGSGDAVISYLVPGIILYLYHIVCSYSYLVDKCLYILYGYRRRPLLIARNSIWRRGSISYAVDCCMGFGIAPDPGHRFFGQVSYFSSENEPQFLTTEFLTTEILKSERPLYILRIPQSMPVTGARVWCGVVGVVGVAWYGMV